jgi:hypothetical protein
VRNLASFSKPKRDSLGSEAPLECVSMSLATSTLAAARASLPAALRSSSGQAGRTTTSFYESAPAMPHSVGFGVRDVGAPTFLRRNLSQTSQSILQVSLEEFFLAHQAAIPSLPGAGSEARALSCFFPRAFSRAHNAIGIRILQTAISDATPPVRRMSARRLRSLFFPTEFGEIRDRRELTQ